MSKTIITSGVESEYVLKELSEYLRSHGWEVYEIEFGSFKQDPYPLLEKYSNQGVIYITSAHTNLTRVVSRWLVPNFLAHYPNYLSPLEIISVLKPALSIYVPHDLLTPYGETNLNEYRFLTIFDFILAPFSGQALQATLGNRTRVIDMGWIKHYQPYSTNKMNVDVKNKPIQVALFVSLLEHLRSRFGCMGVVEYFAPLIKDNVKIKLPAWRGVEKIESLIIQRFPESIVSAESSSIELIQGSDVVICNGASSIHAEAVMMGKPTICLLDNEGFTIDEQKRKLANFPFIYFHDYRRRQSIPDKKILELILTKNTQPVRTFKFELVKEIIESIN